MFKSLANSSRIALGISLLGALALGGLGCGGSSPHAANPDAKDAKTGSAGADATGTAGTDGSAGAAGSTAGTDGGAGAAGSTAGTDGGAGAAGSTAGTDGGAGAGGSKAGTDGGAGAAGTDGGAGAAGSTAGNDGGAGSDAADASDGGTIDGSDGGDTACTNACVLGAKRCGTGGGLQTCVAGSSTCTVWGTEAACGTHSACSTTSGTAACACNTDPNCASETATFCATTSSQSNCAKDADGCFFVTSTNACPAHESCKGNNPTGACSCDAPPAECMNAAGTKFCATSGTLSTCKADSNTCIFADVAVACGTHQACTTPTAGASVCSCVADANCTTAGDICSGSSSIHCATDSDTCVFSQATTACGAHQACDGTTGLCKCNATVCTAAGPFCDAGNTISTCSTDANNCLFESAVTSTTCTANETCQGAAGAAACACKANPAVCTVGAGTYCTTGTEVTTCVADAHGCIPAPAAAAACGPHQTCTGAAGSGACACVAAPTGCTGNGSFCSGTGTQSVCQVDGNGCSFDAAMNTPCPTHQTCKGMTLGGSCTCDDTCSAADAGGTYCVDALHQNTCSVVNTCNVAGSATACVGIMTCRGGPGAGSCQCPAVGTTSGTGCTTMGATICQNNTVLTCAPDPLSNCLSWAQPVDCAVQFGVVCGTKTGGGTVAACQCPERSGNDVIVDPANGNDGASGFFATGIDSPKFCRFSTLGKGLSVAANGNHVIARSDSFPVDFAAETFPLVVPAGVTLTSDVVAMPSEFTIKFLNTGATSGVTLADSSVLEGFTIDEAAGGNAAASLVSIPGTGATVDTVVLNGPLANGISVTGDAHLNAVTVSSFTVGINVASGAGTVLTNGNLQGNATGIVVTNSTLTASSTTVNGGTSNGIVVGAPSTLNGSTLTVSNMTGAGIVSAGTLTLTSGDIGPNGANGINMTGGTGNLGAVNVHQNTGSGIVQAAGMLTLGNGGTTTVQTNTTKGVTLNGGTLNVGAATITGNGGDGVTAATGSTLVSNPGAQYTSNGGNGIAATAATLTFNGVKATPILVTGNTLDGVLLNGGGISGNYVTLSSNGTGATKKSGLEIAAGVAAISLGVTNTDKDNVVLSSNGLHGLHVNGPTLGSAIVVSHANLSSNTKEGISTDLNWGAGDVNTKATFSNLTISSNGSHGVEVIRAPLVSGQIKCVFDTLAVSGNAGSGVFLSGAGVAAGVLNGAGATVQNSTIASNTGFGIRVEEGNATTTEIITGNDISLNSSGGVGFTTASTLNGFSSNKIHSNTGDQITVSARRTGNTTWDFHSATGCDGSQNQIYCYEGGTGVGIRVNAAPVTSVDASSVSWQHAPLAAQAYVVTGTNTITTSPPCAAVSTCP